MHRNLQNKTDEEIVEYLKNRTITVKRPLAQAEERIKISGTIKLYESELDGLCARLMSPRGFRFIRLSDIKSISRK